MGILELLLISIGLGMDAFAVSVCKGVSMKKMSWEKAIIIALYFGGFQMFMPVMGYLLGKGFEQIIVNFDHWFAFAFLSIIGGNMIKESCSDESENINDNIDVKTMLIMAIATSIDALAVGITFAFLKVNLIIAVSLIGIITFVLCVVGTKIGNKFGDKYGGRAELMGGVILILIGVKILWEHLL